MGIRWFINIIFLMMIQSTVHAGMDFSMLTGPSNTDVYIRDSREFQIRTISLLKDIIQQVGDKKEVHRKVEIIQKEMNALAIEAGKTKSDAMVDLQSQLEEILKYKLYSIIDKYDTNNKEYFNTVAEAITALKKFEIPEPIGAMVYAGSEIIKTKKGD